MALTSFVQTNFLGGEISQTAQGRMDLPAYKISLNVCLNAIPIESGAWMRRPGTRHVAPTKAGQQGKLIPFTFAQSFPYLMEFTDGNLRFIASFTNILDVTGPTLVMTDDQQGVASISTATPAVVTTGSPHGWSTGNSVMFSGLGGSSMPLLQNRQFVITVTGASAFSLADSITGAPIDGSTLGPYALSFATRIMEITTAYIAGAWSNLRSVQAETRTLLLNGTHPQVLQVATPPTAVKFATFTYGPSDFLDGPYLDPVPSSQITSSALNGVVTLTLSFAAYVATTAYNIGDFVTDGGIGYKSLTALNQNNVPAASPANWLPVNGGAAVNGGIGFATSDIGRLLRLFSEPPLWAVGSTYAAKDVVAYPDGNGGFSYWTATAAVAAGIQPGTSSLWALNATGAIWTWAQVITVSGSGLIAPATAIGTLTGGGGLAAAFDTNTSKSFATAATFQDVIPTYPQWSASLWAQAAVCQYGGYGYQAQTNITPSSGAPVWNSSTTYFYSSIVQFNGAVYQAIATNGYPYTPPVPPPNASYWTQIYVINSDPPIYAPSLWRNIGAMASPTESVYVGQHYGVAKAIQSATLYPTTNIGFCNPPSKAVSVNLRASNSAPTSPSDGTVLASLVFTNSTNAVTLTSNDQVSTWNYIWFQIAASYLQPLPDGGSHTYAAQIGIAQAQFYAPNTSNGSVITAQIRGPALLYSQTIRTWRLGVYSDTTGWPTCGTYHEGRVWLGGVVGNRFDGGVSNGFIGTQLNFAPTAPGGQVADDNAISYTCTGEDVNQFLWMKTDQQGILAGTKAGEWLISAPTPGRLAPNNIKAVRVTKIGGANIEPHRTEHTLVFVQKFGRKIMEYFADVFSGKFTAPNLSERAKHLTVKGIAEIAYQQELVPVIWARRTDGALIGATYKRDALTTSQGPNIIGWHRHALGSGRRVESLCVGPSANGLLDTIAMITSDPNTGIRHVEMMTDLLDEGFALADCWFLDGGIVPSSTAPATVIVSNPVLPTDRPYGGLVLNGLNAHNGKTVTAFIAGLDCGDFLVSAGAITVPYGDGISAGTAGGLFTADLVASFVTLPAVVGFTYNSDGQLVRPVTAADTGTQAGPGWAKLGRQHRAALQLYGAVNGSIRLGTDFITMDPVRLRQPNDVPYTVLQQWSGIYRSEVNSLYDFDGMITWRISRPLPGFVMAAGGFDSKADA